MAKLAHGTVLKNGGTAVAAVTDLNGPGLTRDTIDITAHDATDNWRDFIKGLKDGGEISLTINYLADNATHDASTGLLEDFSDDTTNTTWELEIPAPGGPVSWTFSGIISGFNPSFPVEGAVTADVTIKVSGKPTLA